MKNRGSFNYDNFCKLKNKIEGNTVECIKSTSTSILTNGNSYKVLELSPTNEIVIKNDLGFKCNYPVKWFKI